MLRMLKRASTLVRMGLFAASTAAAALTAAGAAAAEDGLLVPPTPKEQALGKLIFLPGDADALDAPLSEGERRVLVTGAYSSGDRFAPEGFVLRRGDARLARLQRWDGLLLIDAEGRLSIQDVSSVHHAGENYDLRDRPSRRAFLEQARDAGLSAVQSHLLINEGVLDLSPIPGAKRFRRRLLFETQDGKIGVFDTSPRALTLFEAAEALSAAQAPRFALNLDMGTYDFCEDQRAGVGPKPCGLLNRKGIDKLTNVIAITLTQTP